MDKFVVRTRGSKRKASVTDSSRKVLWTGSKREAVESGGERKADKKPTAAHVRLAVTDVTPTRHSLESPAEVARGLLHLRTHGYVVWKNVVGEQKDVDAHVSRFWDYLEAASPAIRRGRPETWTNDNWPGVLEIFIFRYYGIGQSDFMWRIRTLPALRAFFTAYYAYLAAPHAPTPTPPSPSPPPSSLPPPQTLPSSSSSSSSSSLSFPTLPTPPQPTPAQSQSRPALQSPPVSGSPSSLRAAALPPHQAREENVSTLERVKFSTSFGGCSVLRGGEHAFAASKPWLHVDRNLRATPDERNSVQCSVSLLAGRSSAADGGFICVPGSHAHYKRLVDAGDAATARSMTAAGPRNNITFTSAEHPVLSPYRDGEGRVKCAYVRVEAGDMISWMSTLVHANIAPATKSGQAVTGRLRRLTAFVSFRPTAQLLAAPTAAAAERMKGLTAFPDWARRRRLAAAAGHTAGHDPHEPRDNNQGRPRVCNVAMPASSQKTTFAAEELELL